LGSTALILGAGASRAVSYAHLGEYPSPLDSDFFDLLQRLRPRKRDRRAVGFVLRESAALGYDLRRSMERAFYTLHLRAYLAEKLDADLDDVPSDETVVEAFARSVQALLREAHGTNVCDRHVKLLRTLGPDDVVISFNYDLVPERALRSLVQNKKRRSTFGSCLYGFEDCPSNFDLPLILKMHGSSNWKIQNQTLLVRTKKWTDFDEFPGYLGHKGVGTTFPIFLPFWDKRIETRPWLQLWQRALHELQRTTKVVVCGYSLAPTDVKAQQLFSLGLGNKRFKLCVVDPSSETKQRWRSLFPDAQYWEYASIGGFLNQPPRWWEEQEEESGE
jgi:hypothetical protein